MAIPLKYEQIKSKINNDESGCVLDMTEFEVLDIMKKENKSMSIIKLRIKCGCKNKEIFYTTYQNFNNKKHPKKQCNTCGEKIKFINKTKTTEKFKKEVLELVGTDYEVLTEYISAKDNILLRHKCGYEFTKTPDSFLGHGKRRGARCPKCEGLIRNKTTDYFKEEVFNLVGNEYEVLGEYITSETLILMKHSLCGSEYPVVPASFLSGRRCPKCFGTPKKTTEQFKKEVYTLVGNEYEILTEYITSNDHITIKHNKCGHDWECTPSGFINTNTRCPVCNESKGEQKVRHYCEKNNINFISQFIYKDLLSDYGNPLKFDFAIFNDIGKTDINFLVEYDGEFHYKAIPKYKGEPIKYAEERLVKQQYHDRLKDEYCENNNIKLIRIPYWEFEKVEQILINSIYDDKKIKLEIKDILIQNNINDTICVS